MKSKPFIIQGNIFSFNSETKDDLSSSCRKIRPSKGRGEEVQRGKQQQKEGEGDQCEKQRGQFEACTVGPERGWVGI